MNVKLLVCALEMRAEPPNPHPPCPHPPTPRPPPHLSTEAGSGLKGFAFLPLVWMCGAHTLYLAAISDAQSK